MERKILDNMDRTNYSRGESDISSKQGDDQKVEIIFPDTPDEERALFSEPKRRVSGSTFSESVQASLKQSTELRVKFENLKDDIRLKRNDSVIHQLSFPNNSATESSQKPIEKPIESLLLETIIKRCCTGIPPLYLHPDEYDRARDYTNDELDILYERDYKTRLLICSTTMMGDSVFMSNHFTDIMKHKSHLNYIRDYVKTLVVTKNMTAATSVLTDLLTMFFEMENSQFQSCACTLAAALSNEASNTEFEVTKDMMKDKSDIKIFRRKFILLMRIIFEKLHIKRFLIDKKSSNIYRDVHCMTKLKEESDGMAIVFCVLCFLFQLCLIIYVILGDDGRVVLYDHGSFRDRDKLTMLPLAILSTILSYMRAETELKEVWSILYFYRSNKILKSLDIITNSVLPVVRSVFGFRLIFASETIIDAVLNVTALEYISEIDDMLPAMLHLPEDAIISNYLIQESIEDYIILSGLKDEHINRIFDMGASSLNNIHFDDIYVTNTPETGNDILTGNVFMPYYVKKGTRSDDAIVGTSEYVTDDCLLQRIEWRYTESLQNTCRPCVAYLKIWKLNGEVLEIKQKGVEPESLPYLPSQSLQGVYIITAFQMSESVVSLRLCGSQSVKDFKLAFEHYSLWPLNSSAQRLLSKAMKMETPVVSALLTDSRLGSRRERRQSVRSTLKSLRGPSYINR